MPLQSVSNKVDGVAGWDKAVTDVNNEVTVYKFYAYNNSRCFVTINDKGYTVDKDGDAMTGFYVNRENVETLLRTTRDFNNGYTIDPGI